MITHQGVTASPHRAEKLGLDTGQSGKRHIPRRSMRGVLGNGELSLDQVTIRLGNQGLLGQVEVLG